MSRCMILFLCKSVPITSASQVQPELALRVASATLAATGTLREGSALSMDARERIYLETLLKRMLVSATMRGARPWTLAEGGAPLATSLC